MKLRMRFTVEIPDTKEGLRRMVELLNTASAHVEQSAQERTNKADLIINAMTNVLKEDPENDVVLKHRVEFANIANSYLEGSEFVEYILWGIHSRLIERMKEMNDEG